MEENTKQLEKDLKKVSEMITSVWPRQNNDLDRQTNFIYKIETLDDLLNEIMLRKVDKEYALHRWYNYKTSIHSEYIFCEYGAVHEEDIYNHDIDIYINGIPFDVKLTVYPAKLKHRPYDISTREGKDELIKWFYENQSQEKRKQMLNRIYIVCDTSNPEETLKMKSNFDLMRVKIKEFMDAVKKDGFNELNIEDNGETFSLKTDIVQLKI